MKYSNLRRPYQPTSMVVVTSCLAVSGTDTLYKLDQWITFNLFNLTLNPHLHNYNLYPGVYTQDVPTGE